VVITLTIGLYAHKWFDGSYDGSVLISFIEWDKVNNMRDKFLIDFSFMGRKV
jgi:hypothetical protein